jgi:hypothetical protein
VVPGHASAIPALPPSQAASADTEGRRSKPVDGVESSGPGRRYGVRAPRCVRRKKRSMPPGSSRSVTPLDDDDYPAYTMGRAAEMLGTTPAFLRTLGEHRLITPLRSDGGHRRYSRYQLRIAARARELVDRGTPGRTLSPDRRRGVLPAPGGRHHRRRRGLQRQAARVGGLLQLPSPTRRPRRPDSLRTPQAEDRAPGVNDHRRLHIESGTCAPVVPQSSFSPAWDGGRGPGDVLSWQAAPGLFLEGRELSTPAVCLRMNRLLSGQGGLFLSLDAAFGPVV